MKTEELRELLELCNEHNVSAIEKGEKHIKISFFKTEEEDDSSDALDTGDRSPDPDHTSPRREKPKQEGPYPPSIYPDGEVPSF
jgi:hypothetical protein